MDNPISIGYSVYMLSGIRIYASDNIWRQILADLGATVMPAPDAGIINFDNIVLCECPSPMELKSAILAASDSSDILYTVFGQHTVLPHIQTQIVALLHKTGGMSIGQLKNALGYAPDVSTHALDTAIYQLRQKYGRGFIKNTNGVYSLGKL